MKNFGPIVQHAGTGLEMAESVARQIDEASKNLPKECSYKRMGYNPTKFDLTPGSRSDVSIISTDSVDRDGEVVLPDGLDFSQYNKTVQLFHKLDQLPVGINEWVKKSEDRKAIVAKTKYFSPPPGHTGDWMPSTILHMMQEGALRGKSIGFQPVQVRQATREEKQIRPEWDGCPIISKGMVFEYSVVCVASNGPSEVVAVSKALNQGLIAKNVADFLLENLNKGKKKMTPRLVAKLEQGEIVALKAMAARIAKEDLVELIEPEILVGNNPVAADECAKFVAPSKLKFRATAQVSSNAENPFPAGADMLSVMIESPAMLRIASKSTGKQVPVVMVPIAYVKDASKYLAMDDLDGVSIVVSEFKHIDDAGHETEVKSMTGDADSGMVTGQDGQYYNQSGQMPLCPKCMKNCDVSATEDNITHKGDMYHCSLCNTDFQSGRSGQTSFDPNLGKGYTKLEIKKDVVTKIKNLIADGKVNEAGAVQPPTEENQTVYLVVADGSVDVIPVIQSGEVLGQQIVVIGNSDLGEPGKEVVATAKTIKTLIDKYSDKGLLDFTAYTVESKKDFDRERQEQLQQKAVEMARQTVEDVLTVLKGG